MCNKTDYFYQDRLRTNIRKAKTETRFRTGQVQARPIPRLDLLQHQIHLRQLLLPDRLESSACSGCTADGAARPAHQLVSSVQYSSLIPAPGNIYVTPLRFKLGGRHVLSARFNVETAGSERKRPEF